MAASRVTVPPYTLPGRAGVVSAVSHLQLERAGEASPLGDEVADGFGGLEVVRVLAGKAAAPVSLLVNELLIDRDVNLWSGFGGVGKSTVALHLAVCVALGLPVFGLTVNRSGPVLLVLPEDGEAGARMILDSIIAGLDLDAATRERLEDDVLMIADDSAVNMLADSRAVGAVAKAHRAVLVIFDPYTSLIGTAKENENETGKMFQDRTRRDICRFADAAVLVNAHDKKPSQADTPETAPSAHNIRGGGALVNGARLAFNVAKKGDRITLTSIKSNRIRPNIRHELDLCIEADPANAAKWLRATISNANSGGAAESLTAGVGRSISANEKKALEALHDRHAPEQRLSWSRWEQLTDINKNTFKTVKDRLLDAQLAHASPTGRNNRNGSPEYCYGITTAGLSALATGWASKGEEVRR